MTIVEAETLAAERHGFRGYIKSSRVGDIRPSCWCGWEGPGFFSYESARNAHTRHQYRERRRG